MYSVLVVFLGSMFAWVGGLLRGVRTTKDWFADYEFRGHSLVYFVGDFILFVVFGGFIGIIVYAPTNPIEALAAGITWPSAIALVQGSENTQGEASAAQEYTREAATEEG